MLLPPTSLLAPAWSYVTQKPRNVQTVLAAVGPNLRKPVLDRLVDRGDVDRQKAKAFGIFPSAKLSLASGRRALLMDEVGAVLNHGKTPSLRVGASIALMSADGTLPQFLPRDPVELGRLHTRQGPGAGPLVGCGRILGGDSDRGGGHLEPGLGPTPSAPTR